MAVNGSQLIVTPHPVTLEGQRIIARTFTPDENLGAFLRRTVEDWDADEWEIRVNGHIVPAELIDRMRPKDGTVVEVRGVVQRQALAIVALAALTYFTFGIGTYGGAIGSYATGAYGAFAGTLITSAVYVGGAILINKVLGPKLGKQSGLENDPVYSISSARNQMRHYQPLPILFGTVRITPDVVSAPYLRNLGDDQFLSMGFTPGINVHSVEEMYNGDTALSVYENTEVLLNGFAGHSDDVIPIFTNVDTIEGGELDPGGDPVVRTSSTDAIRLQVDIEGVLYRVKKGKIEANAVVISVEYAPAGSGTWSSPVNYTINNDNTNTVRRSFILAVAEGQYDVRVTCQAPTYNDGQPDDECAFTWTTLGTIQSDAADYTGIPRIWVTIKASGQINGALDEIRCVAHSYPSPLWNGSAWNTVATSNPGAHLLLYARGIYDEDDKLIGGMGLGDEEIDIPALQAFMVHCAANGYTYDAYIKDARNHDEMCDAIALAGMGQKTWAGGKFSVVWAAEDQPITAVAGMANIKRASFQVSYTLANAADGVEYTYTDGEDWTTKTLRVPAPGVETMLNPSQVTGEGVTTEAHAAEMARWHLAQSLYQYKDISFAQDLEHLSYRRLSVLSISHDLTQWGYSGRLAAAVDDAGTVTVTLDEPVPAPSSGTPYIGLRIPGEGAYRVFEVEAFIGTATELTLVEGWPGGVAFPGDSAGNPAHDTIWCYDFRETPGARVRVVQVEPEGDLRGARIAVVPETEEFWTFVKEGEYLPPPNISLLATVPTASNLQIDEVQVSQAGILGVELRVAFSVSGPLNYAAVELLRDISGEWITTGVMVETRTPTARLPVPSPGTYRVRVRPFNHAGRVGTAVTADITVTGTFSGAGLNVGGVLNDDPFFNDPDAWVLFDGYGELPDFVDIDDGSVGTSAIRSPSPGAGSWINGRRRAPVDHTRTYRISGLLRTESGSGSVAFLGVALFDENGDNITGDGTQWFYAASGVVPPGTFMRYSGVFGANTATAFPSNARTMAPLVLLTYDPGGGPHTSVHEAQDVRIEDQSAVSLVALLTNESHTLPADSAGNVSSYSGASGSFKVYAGAVDVSAAFTLSTQANPQGLTVGYTDQAYSVTGGLDAGEAIATLTIRATGSGAYSGVIIDKVFSLAKSVAGAAGSPGAPGADGDDGAPGSPGAPGSNGADAKLLYVISDRQTINYDGAGAPSPSTQTTTFTAQKINTSATVTWSVQDALGNSLTPATSYLSAATGDSVTMTRAQFDAALAVNGAPGVIITGTLTDGVTLSDKISVLKVQAGANGSNGSNGTNGTNGTDGANGLNVATVTVYQRASSTPSVPSATVTFTFASGAVSGLNNGWSATIPADNGLSLWATSAPASSSGSSDTIGTGEWTTPVVLMNGIADIVNITSRTVDSVFAAPEDSYAAYRLNSSGLAQWGSGDTAPVYGPGSMVWITPQTNMANYEVRATVLSGSLSSGTTGSWLNLGTTRSWYEFRGGGPGTTSCTLRLEIRRASDSVIVAEATITLNATT